MSQDLFEKYLQDRLSEPEQRELSRILDTEEGARAFAEFVHEWALLADVSKAMAARGATSKIRIHRVPGPASSKGIWWAAGIAAAVLVGVGWILATRTSSVPAEKPRAPIAVQPRSATPAEPERPVGPVPSRGPRSPEPVAPPAPPPAPPPLPPEEKPAPPALPDKPAVPAPSPNVEPAAPPAVEKATVVVLAKIERTQGSVTVVTPEGRRPARPGLDLLPDQGLETAARLGFAAVKFPDLTRLELGPDSAIERMIDAKGKMIVLSRGTLSAVVPKQPAGKPVAIRTPHAEAIVVGTHLALVVSADATRLEVREGRVRLTRLTDGVTVDVSAGHMAVAGKGGKLESKVLAVAGAFQDGVSPTPAYSGTRDTSLSGVDPARNFGSADPIEADGDEVDGKKIYALLKWDVSEIPPSSAVRSAVVTLNVTDASQGNGYLLFEMKRPWVEGEATWRVFAAGKEWRTPGARSTQDHGAETLGMVAPREKGIVTILLNAAGEALVQSWIRNPATNHGILIANDTNVDGFKFSTRESAVAERRPKLTIEYIPGASK